MRRSPRRERCLRLYPPGHGRGPRGVVPVQRSRRPVQRTFLLASQSVATDRPAATPLSRPKRP
jgi:hypothetical protein